MKTIVLNIIRKSALLFLISSFLLAFPGCDQSPESMDSELAASFLNPPDQARPRVWWHWMNGNVTKEGIRKDLEWMQRVGIRGFHNFDANLMTPVVVENPLVFMTEEWKDAFRYTARLADSLGFEMTIAGSPGWSVTGGPWVEAGDAMKKYVWTETRIEGGQLFNGILPQPADVPGNFQNIKIAAEGGGFSSAGGEIPHYYRDAMVIACRLPDDEKQLSELNPKVRTSGGEFNLGFLTDGDLYTTGYLEPGKVGEEFWIQYEFDSPQSFKAMSVAGANHTALEQFDGGVENRRLLVSDDGVNFSEVCRIPGSIAPQNTVAFPASTGKYWRLAYETIPPEINRYALMFGGSLEEPEPEGVNLAEFVLYTTDRMDQFEDKAGFTPWKEDLPSYLGTGADASAPGDVIDLSGQMSDPSWGIRSFPALAVEKPSV